MKLYLLIMGVGFLLQCAAVPRSSGTATGTVEVELDIFSGRPNPAWKLSEEEASQFLGMLYELPGAEAQPDEGKLGYRGFVVSFKDPQGQVATARIHEGTVERSAGGSTEYFADKDRKLERWLLQASASRLSPDLYDIVAKEVS
ncbi:MAG TPA: hypothetical protein VLE27_12090 [Thermoanaerobaculia bacterium]|nr:hypothetical protein [Thermoanaerobaculia bacterium]